MANVFVNDTGYIGMTADIGDALYWASTQLEYYANCYRPAASGTMVEDFPSNPKKGTSINIKYPNIPGVSDAFEGAVPAEDIEEGSATLTIEHHLWIRHDLTGKEHTLQLDDFNKTVMGPAAEALAQTLDTYMASKYKGVAATNGAAFTAVTDLTTLAGIEPHVTNLDNAGAPLRGRYGILSPAVYNKAALSSAFAEAQTRGAGGPLAAERGELLPMADVGWKKSKGIGLGLPNNIAALSNDNRHVSGTLDDASLTIDGAVSAGAATMNADGGTVSGTWKIGDLFEVAGVDGSYVVTNAGTADGAGAATGITFAPVAPAGGFPDGAVVTFMGDHVKNIVAAPGAFVAASVPPMMVPGQFSAQIQDPDGYSFTMNWHDKAADGSGASITFEMFVACVVARRDFASMLPTPYATG